MGYICIISSKWEKHNRILKVGKKEERIATDDYRSSDKIEPDDFPKALKYLIWKDAFDKSDSMFGSW